MSHDAKARRAGDGHGRWSSSCRCDWAWNGLGGRQDAEREARTHNAVCNALDAAALLVCQCWYETGDGGIEHVDRCARCRLIDELRGIAA